MNSISVVTPGRKNEARSEWRPWQGRQSSEQRPEDLRFVLRAHQSYDCQWALDAFVIALSAMRTRHLCQQMCDHLLYVVVSQRLHPRIPYEGWPRRIRTAYLNLTESGRPLCRLEEHRTFRPCVPSQYVWNDPELQSPQPCFWLEECYAVLCKGEHDRLGIQMPCGNPRNMNPCLPVVEGGGFPHSPQTASCLPGGMSSPRKARCVV
jgi:hypothetical protein